MPLEGATSFTHSSCFGIAVADQAEPDLKDPVMLATYTARIAQFRATVSLALATAVASTLRCGIDHLSEGAVDPADEPGGDEDPDALASGLDD